MRSTISFICLCLVFICCKNTNAQKIKNDWEKLGINGKVKTMRIKLYATNKNGDTTSIRKDGPRLSQVIKFNERGFMTEEISNPPVDGISPRIFKYDSVDRKIVVELFMNKSLRASIKYKYDGYNLIEMVPIYADGRSGELVKYEYNKVGAKIKKTIQKPEGYINYIVKYDDDGNITERVIYDNHNSIIKQY